MQEITNAQSRAVLAAGEKFLSEHKATMGEYEYNIALISFQKGAKLILDQNKALGLVKPEIPPTDKETAE